MALAGGAAALATPVIARLVKRPEELGQTPDGIPAEPHASEAIRKRGEAARAASGASEGTTASEARSEPQASGVTASEARNEPKASGVKGWLRDRNFWLIAVGVGLALSVSIATLFLVRHLETLGIERTQAALVPSAMAIFGIVGKLGAGWLIDRIDARAVVAGALALHALGWAIVASQSSFAAMGVAAAPLGLGGGGFLPLPPVLQGRCFGRDAIGRVGGLHALVGLPFLLASAPLVGWAEGRTGSFAAPFYGLMGVLLLGAAVLACLRIPEVEPGA
jgi:cyanate permease